MSSWTIYSKDGVAKATVKELELHDEWMAESYLTISVKSSVPIDFAVDDYIDYRNERYAIQYDPTLLKKARSGSYGEGFSYDNIKFVNEAQAKIVRCDFNDIVLAPESESNKIHYSTLPTFPFYCETVDDLLDRILANLEDLYPGEFTIIGLNTVRNQERGELTHNDTYIEEYKKWIDPTMTPNTDPYGKIGVAEAVDNINCWNALAKVNEDFGLNFILRGYTIIVGTVGVFTANKFRYGKGNGLYEIERISDSEQQIITRLRAYGSNANLPSRYYANLNMECYGVALADGVGSTTVDIDFKKSLFKNEFNGSEVAVGLRIGSTEYPNSVAWINGVTGKTIINTRTDDPIAKDTKIYFISGINRDEWPVGSRDYATENLPDNMAISRLMLPGFPNKSLYDWVIDNGGTVVDEEKGIATINDFTGAFSKDKYRPYIDSPNTELYSIRPASIYFDGSDDTEDIHPTIEGMTYQGHAIDVITSAEQITDNGVYKEGETVPNFKITLPDLGFDLKEAWVENATINMKDGMCSARAFVIASQPKQLSNGNWECSCKREHDDTLDLWFPYNDFQIKAGDHYVLTGIDMPYAYVNAASERLFTAAIDALVKNHAPRFTFQPRIDELWMQRQHDQHLANPNVIISLHDTLKAGDVFVFADDDLGIDASIIIDVLTIKENGNNGIPTYEITLRDEKQVSPIKKIQNKVEVLSLGGVYGGTGGLSGRQVQSLIDTYGSDRFLSKVNDDEAQGILRFLQSLSVGSDLNVGGALDVRGTTYLHDATRIDGLLRALANIITNRIESEHYEGGWDNPFGSGFQINERSTDHVSFLSVDNLFVRMKAVFTELEIRKISYAGGNIIFSHAGSRIVAVKPIYDVCDLSFDGNKAVFGSSTQFDDMTLRINAGAAFDGTTLNCDDASQVVAGYRCYLMKDDGTTATENWWRVDDQARCQTFNIDETGTYHNVSNSFYWRRVMAVGTELLEDGLNYDYVDLSVIDAIEGSTVPQAGDTIVQMGNRTDTERQGFISIQVAGEYAPSFEVYKGVNSYNLSGKRKICISPKFTEIRANKIVETTETGDYPMPHYRTEAWHTGMQCYYYDVVQYKGSSWLCTYPEGGIGGVPYTTEEPSESATYWEVYAAKGKDGSNIAIAQCTPQVVSIATNTEGRVIEDFRQVLPISMSTNSEELSLFEVSILSGNANVELGPATLESHAGSKTTFSGSTAVIGDAAFSGTTLVLDDNGSTLVPKTLIVKAAAGAILTEHVCEIEVKGYDSVMNEYTAKTSISVQRNVQGNDGSSPVTVFRWDTSGTIPPPISGTAYPPSGWSINPPNRPSGDEQFLWASYSTRYYNGTIAEWGTPVRISGDTGSAGEDAKEREWIYKRSDTNPGTPANPSDRTIDDYVPAGWNDNPLGIDEDHKTEWASWRDFNKETQLWGDFASPVVWSNYGERGMDGDGVEYVFIRTNSNVPPTIVNSPDSRTDSHGHTYTDDEYLPLASGGTLSSQTECTDDPTGTDKNNQFEWVSKRIKILNADGKTRSWQKYVGAMSLWANWSDDGVSVSLTPQSVILTQNEAGAMPTLTDANTKVIVKLGEVDVTSQATIISATPSTYVVSGATYNTCTCTYNNTTKTVTITAIDQHGTETVSGETINKFAEQGYIDIVVSYNGENTTLRFNFYCNLLGTWKREVVGDAEIVVATKTFYVYDKDGNVIASQNIGDYIRSASINTATLTSEVEDPSTGLITKTSELKQTADGLTSEVTQIKTGKNLLKGALSGSNFRCENIMPYPVHPPVRPNVDTDGWMEAPSGNTYICAPDITIKRGKWYVLSFYSKYTSSIIVTTWSSGSTPDKQLSISAGSQSTRHYAAFKYGGTGSVTITICFSVTTLRYPQLELGVNDGDDDHGAASTPTAFEPDSAEETSSRISQSSTEIDYSIKKGLNTTGINITDGTIKLKANKVNFYDSTGSSLNSKIWLDNTTGALHAVDGDFSGKITADEGEVGGFAIGEKTIGTTTHYGQAGDTYIHREGYISVWNGTGEGSHDYGLVVNGGVNLIGRTDGSVERPIVITNPNGKVNIDGNPLNLNTNANNGGYTYIGNNQSNVVVNAANTTFNDNVNLNEETSVGANGVLTIQGILAMNSSVKTSSFTLPANPKVGQFFFCKSVSPLSGDLVITANTNQSIMASDSRSTSTSYNINDDSAIVLYVGSSLWVIFKCN